MVANLGVCVKMMSKRQSDVIVVIIVVDSYMNLCVLVFKKCKLLLMAILDLTLRRKLQGSLGGKCELLKRIIKEVS